MSKNFIIAIDGPAGSGKSTIAKKVAERLEFLYVDTGAMYRAITYSALSRNIADNKSAVIEMIKELEIKLKFESGITRVFLSGEEVTDQIRTPEVNSMVSEISIIPEVRAKLVEIQREFASRDNLVAEGRDTTTVVYPNADIKVFLTANLDIRAKRRLLDFQKAGREISLEEVKANLAKRDKIDSGRDISPLRKAEGAIEIDSTDVTIGQEVEQIINKLNEIRFTESHPN